jgi:hypothetical protein
MISTVPVCPCLLVREPPPLRRTSDVGLFVRHVVARTSDVGKVENLALGPPTSPSNKVAAHARGGLMCTNSRKVSRRSQSAHKLKTDIQMVELCEISSFTCQRVLRACLVEPLNPQTSIAVLQVGNSHFCALLQVEKQG